MLRTLSLILMGISLLLQGCHSLPRAQSTVALLPAKQTTAPVKRGLATEKKSIVTIPPVGEWVGDLLFREVEESSVSYESFRWGALVGGLPGALATMIVATVPFSLIDEDSLSEDREISVFDAMLLPAAVIGAVSGGAVALPFFIVEWTADALRQIPSS
jgi:hypothetical protein